MRQNTFMVVFSPCDKTKKDAIGFKEMAEDYLGHSFRSRNSVPHLTLHLCEDFHNESKLYDFQETISRIRPFTVFINGFGVFPDNGTIFLRPVFDENIRALSQQLSGKRITPHITIARNLNPLDRDRLWEFFKCRGYRHDFLCKKVAILKRVNNRWIDHVELDLGSSFPPPNVFHGHAGSSFKYGTMPIS